MSEFKSPGLSCCPYCGQKYSNEDYSAVYFRYKHEIIHMNCTGCKRAMMLDVLRNKDGLTCSGIFTDLSFEDAKRFADSSPVSIDDVISVHEALKLDNYTRIG